MPLCWQAAGHRVTLGSLLAGTACMPSCVESQLNLGPSFGPLLCSSGLGVRKREEQESKAQGLCPAGVSLCVTGHLGSQLGPEAVGQGLLQMTPSWEVGSASGPHQAYGNSLQSVLQMAPNGWGGAPMPSLDKTPVKFSSLLHCPLLSQALFLAVFFSVLSSLTPSTYTLPVPGPSGPWLLGPMGRGSCTLCCLLVPSLPDPTQAVSQLPPPPL